MIDTHTFGPNGQGRNARHIMTVYRRYVLDAKRKGTQRGARRAARGLLHYRGFIASYLESKRAVIAGQELVQA